MLPPSVSGTGSSPGDWIVSAPASWPTEPVWYQGLGGDEGTWEKQERRTEEFLLATELARALSTSGGGDVVAVVRGGEADRRVVADMAGRLDSTRMAAVGHSFGAVTAARAAERTGWFRSVVAHDPWWGGLPRDDEMTAAWRHSCPMLVLASHAWHKR